MKICITSQGKDLDSILDPRFGRCPFFIFLNKEGEVENVLENPGVLAARGAGIAAAQRAISEGADVIITGNMGPHAFFVLQKAGVKVFFAAPGVRVKDAFSMWQEGKLEEINGPSVGGGFGRGRRRGRGMGFGRFF